MNREPVPSLAAIAQHEGDPPDQPAHSLRAFRTLTHDQ